MGLPLCRLRVLCLTDHRGQALETFVQTGRVDMAEIEAQRAEVLIGLGKERFTRHERDVLIQCLRQQGAGVERLFQGQPEEYSSLRRLPVSQIAKMTLQRGLECIAAL